MMINIQALAQASTLATTDAWCSICAPTKEDLERKFVMRVD